MLTVVLAGLVLQKVMTLEEAEFVREKLGNKPVPPTIKEAVEAIESLLKEFRKK